MSRKIKASLVSLILLAASNMFVSEASAAVVYSVNGTYKLENSSTNLPFSGTITFNNDGQSVIAADINAGALGIFAGALNSASPIEEAFNAPFLSFEIFNPGETYGLNFFNVESAAIAAGQPISARRSARIDQRPIQ